MTDSPALLAEYALNGSESAFRELVARYLDLVYSTALRCVEGDAHLAEDVAQMVFTDLARKASGLPKDVLLGGWLHRHTCFVAGKVMRGQRRRQARERQAAEMNALHHDSEENLAHLGPVLDEAINALGAADRAAILLRFFEHRDFRSVGQALGSNEDTAQKRVSRALDKLHSFLTRRGVTLSATALGTALTANAVTAAPAGLAATISGTALAGAAAGGGIVFTLFKVMAMTKLKLGILVVAGLAVPAVMHYSSGPTAPDGTVASVQNNSIAEPGEASETPETELAIQQPSAPVQRVTAGSAVNMASFDPRNEIMKGRRLSDDQAQALELILVQNPEDLAARCQLIGYYSRQRFTSPPARKAHQSHVLWFIQRHPELSLGREGRFDPLLDEPVYGQAKALWLQHASDNPQNPTILGNAAEFCLLYDRSTAEAFLKQAQALESTNPTWAERLAQLYALEAKSVQSGAVSPAAAKALEQMETAQAKTTDEQKRFYNLDNLAQMAFDVGEIGKAQAYAKELLQHVNQQRSNWSYGNAIYRGNLVLGRIALRNGRMEEAKQYLLASGQTTGSPNLGSFGPNMSLARELLEQGEKETVLEFFKLCASFWGNDKLETWAQQVNEGHMPDFGPNLSY